MIVRERKQGWPIMVRTSEEKVSEFNEWLNNQPYSGCASICEFDTVKNGLVIVVDCDHSTGRREILA